MHVSNCYKTQKMCKKAVGACPFMLDCVPHRYKMKDMCDKAVDACLLLLQFVLDLFVTNKMLKDLDDAVSFNDDIVFVNSDSDNVSFFNDNIGLVSVDLNNGSLDDDNSDDDHDIETNINDRLLGLFTMYRQLKACTKEISKESMPVVWYLTKWWGWSMSADEKKKK